MYYCTNSRKIRYTTAVVFTRIRMLLTLQVGYGNAGVCVCVRARGGGVGGGAGRLTVLKFPSSRTRTYFQNLPKWQARSAPPALPLLIVKRWCPCSTSLIIARLRGRASATMLAPTSSPSPPSVPTLKANRCSYRWPLMYVRVSRLLRR